MAAIYSNGGNRWNILGFNFTKRDGLSSVYKISMVYTRCDLSNTIRVLACVLCNRISARKKRLDIALYMSFAGLYFYK
jgi:hypothetical protein